MTKVESTFVGVDWGTSSFRLWVFDDQGDVLAESKSSDGIESLPQRNFPEILDIHLKKLGIHGSVPIVICGMAGAKQGWHEAPYIDVPSRFGDLPQKAIIPDPARPHIRILPGLAKRDIDHPDVMRGEETQILGFCLESDHPSGLFCLPGTHSKWVTLENGYVTDFSTSMTGEIYALLTKNSVLRHLPKSAKALEASREPSPDFRAGLIQGMGEPAHILQNLFGLRARSLLFPSSRSDLQAFLSGLLIGLEIAALPKQTKGTLITLIGDSMLLPLYEAGFSLVGYKTLLMDGQKAAQRGLFYAACQLWPQTDKRVPHDAA